MSELDTKDQAIVNNIKEGKSDEDILSNEELGATQEEITSLRGQFDVSEDIATDPVGVEVEVEETPEVVDDTPNKETETTDEELVQDDTSNEEPVQDTVAEKTE